MSSCPSIFYHTCHIIYFKLHDRFSAPGKVVAIILSLRKATDSLLRLKVSEPGLNLDRSPILDLVAKLLTSDGLLK